MVANVNKLNGKIAENNYTKKRLAEELGITEPTLRKKMYDANAEFFLGETVKIQKILKLTNEEYIAIFHSWDLN
jgi:hypothetical protein